MKQQLDSAEPKEVVQYDSILDRDYDDVIKRDSTPEDGAFRTIFQELHLNLKKHFAIHNVACKNGGRATYQNMYNPTREP